MNKRELKFRVWLNKRGHFLYSDSNNVEETFALIDGNAMFLKGKDWFNVTLLYDIDGVIEQFTGLKDETGFEIYEGDIINTKSNRYVVEYDESSARFIVKGLFYKHEIIDLSATNKYGLVIGNIFENSELLETCGVSQMKEYKDLTDDEIQKLKQTGLFYELYPEANE